MLMRYHPDLTIGHTYHKSTSESLAATTPRDSPLINEHHNSDLDLDNQPEIADPDSQSATGSNATMDSMDRGWEDESQGS